MHSIRTKSILLNLVSIAIAIASVAVISSITIASFGHRNAEQSLTLHCETGKNNLNYYFKSAEQSLNSISGLINDELSSISDSDFSTEFHNHIEHSKTIFGDLCRKPEAVCCA